MNVNKRYSCKTLDIKRISRKINVFHGRQAPEISNLVGYGAIIDALELPVPLPSRLALISEKHRRYQTPEWLVFTPRHKPADTLYGHLVFAMKYEGINLLLFKKLFDAVDTEVIEKIVKEEKLGQYCRKIWFLYEWILNSKLNIPDLKEGNYVPLIDEELQYAIREGVNSPRQRIRNNLPGTVDFCPLIFKTEKLNNYVNANLSEKTSGIIKGVKKDVIIRASGFLILKDSKASFNIEGENPTQDRVNRWSKVIGQAGSIALSLDEFLRLQKIAIENQRFVSLGLRTKGGFVGEHDRETGMPLPLHISARHQDLEILIKGLLETSAVLQKTHFNPVLTAASISFGFVFIHPFADGNGRIHRYLIHHLLSTMKFTAQGIVFPVSAVILEHIDDYRKVLENYSLPVLDYIKWKQTDDHNVEVLNETIDYYRYFDATAQAEFLFDCVDHTIRTTIPREVSYLQNYDEMKAWLNNKFGMPDIMVASLIRYLGQNNGILSNKRRKQVFKEVTTDEIKQIENKYKEIFRNP